MPAGTPSLLARVAFSVDALSKYLSDYSGGCSEGVRGLALRRTLRGLGRASMDSVSAFGAMTRAAVLSCLPFPNPLA